jgi:outer membrane lipoprotein carrier protein
MKRAASSGRRQLLANAAFGVGSLLLGSWARTAAAQTGDAVQLLRNFARNTDSGRAAFTQTVISADGARRKVSTGQFEFARPNRFRFAYAKPYEQLIVSDGQKVWIHDPDLQQASSRSLAQALGSTPASLLVGGAIDTDFTLSAQPARDGLEWVLAKPRQTGGSIQSVQVGFRAGQLARLDVEDSFGQRSQIAFNGFEANAAVPAERFRFVPPPGTDVIEQP